tara:strand:+ start:127 stop:834 length:708 start_codon:yes stop_codon:yes gene_type:complete
MLKIGSISTDTDGSKTIYVDYNDKTKKVICKLFKWKNLTQKRLLKLLLGTMDYKMSTDTKFTLDKEDGLNAHLMITHHKAFDNVKVKRVKKYKPTKSDKEIIENVSSFLTGVYQDKIEGIQLPRITFSTALQRSEYNNISGISISKGIDGNVRDKFVWRIYDGNPAMLSSGKGIECSEDEFTTLNLIHELTHYLQDISNNELEESEPTINELEYCENFYPHLFSKLNKRELKEKI